MPAALPHLATLDAALSHYARTTPDTEITVWDDASITYLQADGMVDTYCGWLEGQGVGPGDRVALIAPPGLHYLLTLMATSRLGAIYVGVNPRYSCDEISHALAITTPKVMLHAPSAHDPDLASRAAAAAGDIAVLPAPTPATPENPIPSRRSPAAADDIAVIVFTSGSTGKPKGAALHHGGLIDAATAQHDHLDGEPRRYLSNLPINHVGAIMNTTMGCLIGGGTLIFQEKFDADGVLELIARHRVETWLQVPAMFTLVVNRAGFERADLSSLRAICIGGGAVSAPTLARLRATGAGVFVEYGQTEVMSSLSYSEAGAPDEVLINSIGTFDPRFTTRIADASGNLCAPGEVGEIQARGNCVLRSYWGNAEATRDAFTADGWLKTGDLATLRPDGNAAIKGRLREMIKSGGYNVYPREVEIVIETHPAIAEVVVYGAPDEVYGEAVRCAVECKPGATVTAEALKQHCSTALANYKIPKVFSVAPMLPRLNNGKIDRVSVRAARL